MAMTPIMRTLRRAIRQAVRPADATDHARRSALQTIALGGTAAMMPSWLAACSRPHDNPVSREARVVVVGAGIAGMRTAHLLRTAPGGDKLKVDVFEAASRIGGRIYSVPDLLVKGVSTEMGGEFIDSDHAHILSIASDFNLELVDLETEPYSNLSEVFFFDGRLYTEADIVREIEPVLVRMQHDIDRLPTEFTTLSTSPAASLDMISLESYITSLGITGWLRSFLEVAFVTENGLELGDQSALNMLTMISTDLSSGSFQRYGPSDERYKIRGGNQQLVQSLARSVQQHVHLGHVLERIAMVGNSYALTFRRDHTSVEVAADFVVLAIPFTTLRDVRIDLDLPAAKRHAIETLRYGNNSKVVLSFDRPFWYDAGHNGVVFTDTVLQNVWENTAMLGAKAAGLTVFNAGAAGRTLNGMTNNQIAPMVMSELARIWPDVTAAPVGRVERFAWESYPFTKGSYSGYGPGQWTSMYGVEGRSHGRMFFVGEHCSKRYKGFMNGAAETAAAAARGITALLA